MAITLASDGFGDAKITDGIGLGDLASATRLWVRHWPSALAAAHRFVEPAEVPGLAAEALIGTVAAIAIGRGPREDVAGFVSAAVRELGDDEEPFESGDPVPVLFVSPTMSRAFDELDPETRRVLRDAADSGTADERALTVLQHYYLAEHIDSAQTQACRRTHISLMSAVDGSARDGLAGQTWLHLSTCAWCTEAFHEVAFSNTALAALVDPAVLARVPDAPVAPVVEPVSAEPLLEDTAAYLPAFDDEESAEARIAPALFVDELIDPLQRIPLEDEIEGSTFGRPQPVPVVPEDHGTPAAPVEHGTGEHAAVRTGAFAILRGNRGRIAAAGLAAVAAVAVLLVVVLGQAGDGTSPASAAADPTGSAALESPDVFEDPSFGEPQVPTSSPTSGITTAVAGPLVTAATTATAAATAGATEPVKPKPTKKPTKKPAPQPTQSSAPTPTAQPTTAEPTPTPTATPTKRCNAIEKLLGLC